MRWFHRRSPAQPPPPPDRNALIAAWSKSMVARSPTTRRCYRRHIHALLPACGCAALTTEDLSVLSRQIEQEPHSVSWRKQRCSAFRHLLRWAIAHGYAPHLTEADLRLLRLRLPAERQRDPIPDEALLQRLFGRGTTLRDQLLVAQALELGWTPQRLVTLNCGDIQDTTVQSIPVSPSTMVLLHRYVGNGADHPHLPLFRSRERDGNVWRLSPSQARRILHAAAQKEGLTLPFSRAVRRLARHRGIPRNASDAR